MENNLKREILLKQDTPMWHFQSYQSGCCLRATEVKPKLDKFLAKLKDFEDSYYQDKSNDDKSKNNALDYKLWFEPIGCPKEIPIEKPSTDKFGNPKLNKKGEQMYDNLYPLFFANMGATDRDKKHLVYYPEGVTMHLFSFNTKLLNFVEENLRAFFASHSFGTRQDKGFGFFSLKDKPLDLSGAKYVFELPNTIGENDFESLFQYINYFHKMIRSGINENGVYYKSFMYFYAKEKCNTTWDKPVIRYKFEYFHPKYIKNENLKEEISKFIRDAEDYQKGNKENKIKLYTKSRSLFRDALGLASRQLWKGYSKDIITIQSNNKDVVRFKSPITYRPIYDNGWSVYIYLNQRDLEEFKQYQFTIKNRNNSNEYVDYMGETKVLKNMRIYKEFSLEEYFDFIIQIGLDRHTDDSKEHGEKTNDYVEHIFTNNNFKKINQNANTTK